ncbi:MAG: CPBP family intramembrane metalloprotease [Nitrospirae bacterium]|nr:CPBP family intramembrane metalloprotease [Nitrospirota bacterium]
MKLIKSSNNPFNVPWSIKDIVLIFILNEIIMFPFYFMFNNYQEQIYFDYLESLIVIFIIISYMKYSYRIDLNVLGLKKDNLLQNTSKGLLFGFITFVLVAILSSSFSKVISSIKININFILDIRNFLIPIFWKKVCLLCPFKEELLMRGLIYAFLRKKMNILISFITCSLFFTALHISSLTNINISLTYIFFMSSIYCLLYEKYQSIVPSVSAHLFCNVLAIYANVIINL